MSRSIDSAALWKATAAGTLVQLAMVLGGHWVPAVAEMFAPLGMLISLLAGVLYALLAARGTAGAAAVGGALAGGLCALFGIVVSWGLGDVTAAIIAFGTVSSAVTGAIGGMLGRWIARPTVRSA